MGTMDLCMDLHTQDRLEALVMLLHEADPGHPWDRHEVLRHAVDEGLRVMLGEVLMHGRRRGHSLQPHETHLSA